MLSELDLIKITRLNYEWRNLVNLIKAEDPKLWDEIYANLIEHLERILGDLQVQISSEYMIFDNLIRQLASYEDSNFIVYYETIVSNYKQVFGLSCFLTLERIRRDFKRHKLTRVANVYFEQINKFMGPNADLGDEDITFHSFELNVDNLPLIDSLEENYPNYKHVFDEFRKYAEAIYMFEIDHIVPDMDQEESELNPEISNEDAAKLIQLLLSSRKK
jgi:hypothetical protein